VPLVRLKPVKCIPIKILYAGNPGGKGEQGFTAWSRQHFARVDTTDVLMFEETEAGGRSSRAGGGNALILLAEITGAAQGFVAPVSSGGAAGSRNDVVR